MNTCDMGVVGPASEIHILATMPAPASLRDAGFVVHDLARAGDPELLLQEVGQSVRGVLMSAGQAMTLDAPFLDRLPGLELVSVFGVGLDRIDLAAARARDIVVTTTAEVLTEEMADFTMGLLIMTVRRLQQAERHLREGRWAERPFPLSPSLRGRTVGIVGLGRIGAAVAKRCEAFGLEIGYFGRREQAVPYRYYPSLVELARASSILIVTAAGGKGTAGLVNADVLAALDRDAVLINVARGEVVDEVALAVALRERRLLAAGLDVYSHEPDVPADLLALDNVVLLPHVGTATVQTRAAMAALAVRNLVSWFSGQGPVTPVVSEGEPSRAG